MPPAPSAGSTALEAPRGSLDSGSTIRQVTAGGVAMVTADPDGNGRDDLDGNGASDLVIDFGTAYGVWVLSNWAFWAPLHPLTTDGISVGDLGGNGHDDVIIDFGAAGIWSHDDVGGWQQLHGFNPKTIAVGRF